MNKKLSDLCKLNIKQEHIISLFGSDWFYIIPAFKVAIDKTSIEFEISWLTFYWYCAIIKDTEDES